jgi:hypothetical protein
MTDQHSTVLRRRHSSLQSTPPSPIRLLATSHLPDLLLAPNRIASFTRPHLPRRANIDRLRALRARRRAGRRQPDACACADPDHLRNEPHEFGRRGACDDEDHEGAETSRYVLPPSRGDCGGVLVGPCWVGLTMGVLETRDGKKSYDSPPHSKEMIRMNTAFARMHGASSLLNLLGLLATMWYGVVLAERLR